MKNIEIALVVRAESVNNAENIAMRELMELAKAVAKRKGASMSQGSGSASPITSDAYQVNATVALNCDANINDILAEVQSVWMGKPDIVHSAFAIAEEKHEPEAKKENHYLYTCEECGNMFDSASDGSYINAGTNNEYWMCHNCIETKDRNGEIDYCENCDTLVDNIVSNPVTHRKNICPICGGIL